MRPGELRSRKEGEDLMQAARTPGFASCLMLTRIGPTTRETKTTVTIMIDKHLWESLTFVSAQILDTGYFTEILNVLPTAVDSNIAVARGSLCVQT